MTIVNGDIQKSRLGNNYNEEERFQIVVPKNTWFAARLINETGFALVGCTVAPGFNFDDFEMASKKQIASYSTIQSEFYRFVK